jgi:hypothetical protein
MRWHIQTAEIKKNPCQPRILYKEKLTFKSKDITETFLKWTKTENVATKLVLN